MTMLRKIRSSEQGASSIEMAIALPVIVFLIYGMFEAAMLLYANAGIQHAVGQGARLATIYPTPTDTAVSTKVSSEFFGTQGITPIVTVTPGSSGTKRWKTITVTYTKNVNFLFLTSRNVTLTSTKRVYTVS